MKTLSLMLCIYSSSLAFAQDWPTYLGPQSNNKSTETGLPTSWPEEGPPILWKKPVGEGYAAPSIVGDRLFFYDRKANEDRLVCLDANTGEQKWEVKDTTTYADMYGFSDGPRCSPLVDGDRVFTYSAGGLLNCRKVDNGELIWSLDTVKKYNVQQNFFGVGASPVIYKDLIIVMIGGSPEGSPNIKSGNVKGNGTAIVAFDKKTGRPTYQLGNELASYATPVITNGKHLDSLLVFSRGGLSSIEPSKGVLNWFQPWRAKKLESVNAASPVVWKDQVLITESYQLGSAVLDLKGKVLREDKPRALSLASHWATPIIHEGYLYGSHGMGGNSDFRCVKWDTGEVVWTKKGIRHATPLYVDGHLLVTSESGDLHLIKADPTSYQEIWKLDKLVKRPNYTGPVLAHGKVYIQGPDQLVCLKLM